MGGGASHGVFWPRQPSARHRHSCCRPHTETSFPNGPQSLPMGSDQNHFRMLVQLLTAVKNGHMNTDVTEDCYTDFETTPHTDTHFLIHELGNSKRLGAIARLRQLSCPLHHAQSSIAASSVARSWGSSPALRNRLWPVQIGSIPVAVKPRPATSHRARADPAGPVTEAT